VGAVSFDYGAKHNHREIPLAAWHCAQSGVKHDMIDLDFVNRLFASDLLKSGGEIPEGHYAHETMKQTVVPFRNGIMLAIACGLRRAVKPRRSSSRRMRAITRSIPTAASRSCRAWPPRCARDLCAHRTAAPVHSSRQSGHREARGGAGSGLRQDVVVLQRR
jgi:hypothetical protein